MATKTGFQYYSVETDRYQDKKIRRLKNECGCNGLAVYDFILCEIYRVKGCFLEWDESTAFDVADYFGLKENQVKEIVNYCCAVGLFSKELLTNERVLTSLSIQSRFIDWSKKAKRATPVIPEKLLLLPEVGPKVPEQPPDLPEETIQSKVKKSKVKKNELGVEEYPEELSPENPAPHTEPPRYLVREMLSIWKVTNPNYPVDTRKDSEALQEIGKFLSELQKEPYHPDETKCVDTIIQEWRKVSEFVPKHNFFSAYSLSQVKWHMQSIIQSMRNGTTVKDNFRSDNGQSAGAIKLAHMLKADIQAANAGGNQNP